ncbi:MAG TPA: 50S ribosomal protein L25/general stress protein Ctc [bacterium]|nr:50S ribosomal protein L25/general stress protein Ctc [bacterium]
METVPLNVKARKNFGSRIARAIRREGKIPAILYGHGMEPLSLEVEEKALHKVLHTKAGENVLITLNVQDTDLKESTCLIKEIQHDPRTDEIQHVDFTVISLTEKIEVKVPLILKHTEEAPGIKEGGVLDVVHHEVEVECLPTQIPERIEVDIKTMKIGDSIHVKDLPLPADVVCKLPSEDVVIALHPPRKEEEAPAATEEITQPEVIEKGKKAEEEAPETEEKKPAEKKPAEKKPAQ